MFWRPPPIRGSPRLLTCPTGGLTSTMAKDKPRPEGGGYTVAGHHWVTADCGWEFLKLGVYHFLQGERGTQTPPRPRTGGDCRRFPGEVCSARCETAPQSVPPSNRGLCRDWVYPIHSLIQHFFEAALLSANSSTLSFLQTIIGSTKKDFSF